MCVCVRKCCLHVFTINSDDFRARFYSCSFTTTARLHFQYENITRVKPVNMVDAFVCVCVCVLVCVSVCVSTTKPIETHTNRTDLNLYLLNIRDTKSSL